MAIKHDRKSAAAVRSVEAEKAASSQRSVARRAQTLKDDPMSLASSKALNGSNGLPKSDAALAARELIEGFFDTALTELTALRERVDLQSIERAAALILDCEARGGRVHVTGIGKSEHVARYLASLLSSTGTPAYFLHATECSHGSAGQVRESDVTIAISNSGTTPELMCAVDALHELGTKIVGISSNRQSELASVADELICVGVHNEGGQLNLVPRVSILAKIYVLCALTVVLESKKGLTREQYAKWHPGGALGRLARGE